MSHILNNLVSHKAQKGCARITDNWGKKDEADSIRDTNTKREAESNDEGKVSNSVHT